MPCFLINDVCCNTICYIMLIHYYFFYLRLTEVLVFLTVKGFLYFSPHFFINILLISYLQRFYLLFLKYHCFLCSFNIISRRVYCFCIWRNKNIFEWIWNWNEMGKMRARLIYARPAVIETLGDVFKCTSFNYYGLRIKLHMLSIMPFPHKTFLLKIPLVWT